MTTQGPPYDGKPCPCCPGEIRNLGAVVHNLLNVWDDLPRRYLLHDRMEELRRALAAFQPLADAHFADRFHSHGEKPPPPVDRSKLCTTSGEPPEKVRAEQTNETGQHKSYIVLCEEERAKGFVRPYRDRYQHVGPPAPKYPLRDLTREEHERYGRFQYVKYEAYPEGSPEAAGSVTGSFWTQARLDAVGKGCGAVTTMGRKLSETYARDPHFYGVTFCVGCNRHLPVAEFVWTADGQRVGS